MGTHNSKLANKSKSPPKPQDNQKQAYYQNAYIDLAKPSDSNRNSLNLNEEQELMHENNINKSLTNDDFNSLSKMLYTQELPFIATLTQTRQVQWLCNGPLSEDNFLTLIQIYQFNPLFQSRFLQINLGSYINSESIITLIKEENGIDIDISQYIKTIQQRQYLSIKKVSQDSSPIYRENIDVLDAWGYSDQVEWHENLIESNKEFIFKQLQANSQGLQGEPKNSRSRISQYCKNIQSNIGNIPIESLSNLQTQTVDKMTIVFEDLSEDAINELSTFMCRFNSLSRLEISISNKIDDQNFPTGSLSILLNCLPKLTSLAYLSISLPSNGFTMEQSRLIAQILPQLVNLNSLQLNLQDNFICDKGAKLLGESLGQLNNLQELKLNLKHNKVITEGAKYLSQCLAKLQDLRKLDLNLECNEISDRGAIYIGKQLSKISNLAKLHLNISLQTESDSEVESIGKGLSKMVKLKIQDMKIKDDKKQDI